MVIKENGRNDSRIHLCEGLHSVNGKFFVFTQHTSYKSMPPKFVLCMSTGFYSAHGLSLVLNITPKKGTHTQAYPFPHSSSMNWNILQAWSRYNLQCIADSTLQAATETRQKFRGTWKHEAIRNQWSGNVAGANVSTREVVFIRTGALIEKC